ncbi:MAG: hypothetical protein ACOY0S_00250, partial [Patescibacteria group bacterium]
GVTNAIGLGVVVDRGEGVGVRPLRQASRRSGVVRLAQGSVVGRGLGAGEGVGVLVGVGGYTARLLISCCCLRAVAVITNVTTAKAVSKIRGKN